MDLGATVCLARVPRCTLCPLASACPSRGRRYAPLRRQGRFEGSFRQRRAATLRLVAEGECALGELDAEAVAALRADGLIEVANGMVALPTAGRSKVAETRRERGLTFAPAGEPITLRDWTPDGGDLPSLGAR